MKINSHLLSIVSSLLAVTLASINSAGAQSKPKAKTQLYVVRAGVPRCPAYEVSTSQDHMGCATKEIGWTITDDDDSATQTALYSGLVGNCNAGAVSTNPRHVGCDTAPIGFAATKAAAGSGAVQLFVGTVGECNAGFVSTKAEFDVVPPFTRKCGADPIGYAVVK